MTVYDPDPRWEEKDESEISIEEYILDSLYSSGYMEH